MEGKKEEMCYVDTMNNEILLKELEVSIIIRKQKHGSAHHSQIDNTSSLKYQ